MKPDGSITFQACNTLKPKELCFRLHRYNEGKFDELFHEHVPKYRISKENLRNVMFALVAKYSESNDSFILRSFLNNRGKKPRREQSFRVSVDYIDSGIREYCNSGDISISVEEVF